MSKLFLGVDTSCYTTSLCLMDERYNIISDSRKILKVKDGSKGLRQNEMIFQHINNLTDLYEQIASEHEINTISAIAVTNRPRNIEGSYMPAFLSGLNFAKTLSITLGIPLYFLSHQEAHVYGSMLGSSINVNSEAISVHMSGGTTEILKTYYKDFEIHCEIIGGTKDISFGQLIDRIGVHKGLGFPAGSLMNKAAVYTDIKSPKVITDGYFNLSGLENYYKSLTSISEGEIYYSIFKTVVNVLYDSLIVLSRKYMLNTVILAGGVASNTIIKDMLVGKLAEHSINCYIPDPRYCSDSGIGAAYYAILKESQNSDEV